MIFDYVEDAVEDLKSLPDFECSCNDCATMCKQTPCVPTPEEAVKLIDAGFEDKLCIVNNVPSKQVPDLGQSTQLLSPRTKQNDDLLEVGRHFGTCVFLENDLCLLHDSGLKPSEGKKVVCNKKSEVDIREMVVRSWEGTQGEEVLNKWKTKVNF